MRALRVVGLGEGGQVLVEDSVSGERFTVPADERLTAAARGDISRFGQAQTELESHMRPREIQARIRAGASVEEVAALSGLPPQKIERFAYPVLMERYRAAELAQKAHPIREDGPDVQTLTEVVAYAFSQRSQDYQGATWDSWRGEDGKWVVQLRWKAGRSDNKAHWVFHPGAHGGTVTAVDEPAMDLIDPMAGRALRTVRPVTALAQQAVDLGPEPLIVEEPVEEPAPTVEVVEEPVAVNQSPARPAATRPAAATAPKRPARPRRPVLDPPEPATHQTPAKEAPPEAPAPEPATAERKPAAEQSLSTHTPARTTESQPRTPKSRKNHPIVPSWEDVLLGVRSQRN